MATRQEVLEQLYAQYDGLGLKRGRMTTLVLKAFAFLYVLSKEQD